MLLNLTHINADLKLKNQKLSFFALKPRETNKTIFEWQHEMRTVKSQVSSVTRYF